MKKLFILAMLIVIYSSYSNLVKNKLIELEKNEYGYYFSFDALDSTSYLTTAIFYGKYTTGAEFLDYLLIQTDDAGETYDTVYSKRLIRGMSGEVKVLMREAVLLNKNEILGTGLTWQSGQNYENVFVVKTNTEKDTLDFTYFDYKIQDYRVQFLDDSLCAICLLDLNVSLITRDSGSTWKEISLPDSNMVFKDLNIINGKEIFALAKNEDKIFVLYSNDTGDSWNVQNDEYDFMRIFFKKDSIGFATNHKALNLSTIFKTTDRGKSWEMVNHFSSKYSNLEINNIINYTDTTLLAFTGKELFYSEDEGDTWKVEFLPNDFGVIRDISRFQHRMVVVFISTTGTIAIEDNETGYKIFDEEDEIQIYPNPVNSGDAVYLTEINRLLPGDKITVYDIFGNVVNKYEYNDRLIAPYHSGLYYIEIKSNNRIKYKKLLVK